MVRDRGRAAALAAFVVLATTLLVPLAVRDTTPVRPDATGMAFGLANDHVEPGMLPHKGTQRTTVLSEPRSLKGTALLLPAILAAALALCVSALAGLRRVHTVAPPLSRGRSGIGLRAPPSFQPA